MDEEPFAPNNPKGYQGKLGSQGFRFKILINESCENFMLLLDEVYCRERQLPGKLRPI